MSTCSFIFRSFGNLVCYHTGLINLSLLFATGSCSKLVCSATETGKVLKKLIKEVNIMRSCAKKAKKRTDHIGWIHGLVYIFLGAQWLSDRVVDLRSRGCWFEPHLHHCLCPWARHINSCLVLVQPRKTYYSITEKSVDWDVKNQRKNKKFNTPALS